MKTQLLSLFALATTINLSAQCVEGFSTTGVYDSYTSETEVGGENGGMWHWGEPDLGGDAAPNYQAVLTRNTVTQSLDMMF